MASSGLPPREGTRSSPGPTPGATPEPTRDLVVIRGGGDLGTGIAHTLHRAGYRVCVLDRPRPTALRLTVAFAAAALSGSIRVEGVEAVSCGDRAQVDAALAAGKVALWTGAEAALALRPAVVVDARMRSLDEPLTTLADAPLVIGVGPGFEAGRDAHRVVESNRGPRLGAVLDRGAAERHTGLPGAVQGERERRLLRAPRAGAFERLVELGDLVAAGDAVGLVAGAPVLARLDGMVRGLKLSGVEVGAGHKVGDVDPRRDQALLSRMTDKAQAVGRGVLEAIERARADRLAG